MALLYGIVILAIIALFMGVACRFGTIKVLATITLTVVVGGGVYLFNNPGSLIEDTIAFVVLGIFMFVCGLAFKYGGDLF